MCVYITIYSACAVKVRFLYRTVVNTLGLMCIDYFSSSTRVALYFFSIPPASFSLSLSWCIYDKSLEGGTGWHARRTRYTHNTQSQHLYTSHRRLSVHLKYDNYKPLFFCACYFLIIFNNVGQRENNKKIIQWKLIKENTANRIFVCNIRGEVCCESWRFVTFQMGVWVPSNKWPSWNK